MVSIDLSSFKLVSSKNIIVTGKKEVRRRYSIKDICGNESYCDHTISYLKDVSNPVFEQIGPLCQYSVAPKLPLVSKNGITGTWISGDHKYIK
ncbi:MAG: hypothetical protein MZV70_45915 [Desulfobacterales bacterium]|nr:hypothetical protein [Desulfobacterales bacterium]